MLQWLMAWQFFSMVRSLSLLSTRRLAHRFPLFRLERQFCSVAVSTDSDTSSSSLTNDNLSDHSAALSLSEQQQQLDASRLGLEPADNTRHCPLVYHEDYSFPGWPENHTFPMDKFARTAHALMKTSRLPTVLTLPQSPITESAASSFEPLVHKEEDFFRPLDLDTILQHRKDWLILRDPQTHRRRSIMDPHFVQQFLEGRLSVTDCRRIGFREQTSRPELIRRTVLEVAGTVLTAQLALQFGLAANVAGGTHHAHPEGGAGYTILNDLAVATNVVTKKSNNNNNNNSKDKKIRTVQRVLVIDCDVHQGDGTARFGAPGQPLHNTLFTLSLHCGSNYPQKKAHSTIDVDLPDKMTDEAYLQVLEDSVSKAVNMVQPDLVIYDAGVDIYEKDVLGRLRVTEDGIRKRDFYVLDYCVSRGIPVAAVVGGGYDKDVDQLARRHAIVHEEAARVWQKHRLWERAPRLNS